MKKFILNMEKVIKCDFKPGLVERSIDLDKGMPAGNMFNSRPPITIRMWWKTHF
jgi:hypothetical protein